MPSSNIFSKRRLYSPELIREVAKRANARHEAIPEKLRKVFVTAYETSPEWHIRMQAAFQEFTDNAVSKTVNFPKEATVEDIRRVYELAYKLGCKGVTVYRAGSREGEVLTVGHKKAESEEAAAQEIIRPTPRKRPRVTTGQTIRIKTGCGTLYVTINADDQGICEVFTTIGKAGSCAGSFSEATARIISLALRSGVDPRQVVKQLKGIRCPHPIWQDGKQILSCPDAIAHVLEEYLQSNGMAGGMAEAAAAREGASRAATPFTGSTCPECSGNMVEESGCATCLECGFSRCS